MKINKQKSSIIFFIILIVVICFNLWKGHNHKKIIESDMQLTHGIISTYQVDLYGWPSISYSFSYNKIEFSNEKSLVINIELSNSFLKKSFPVIFSKSNPKINEMLILPKDFEKYNLQYPDSLQWVQKLIDKKSYSLKISLNF